MQEAEKPKMATSCRHGNTRCYRHSCKISQISSRVSFLQQLAVMLVESATARKSVSAGMPSSAKLVGRPISLINAASASIPAAAVSSSLPLGAMPQTFCAQRVNRAVPDL